MMKRSLDVALALATAGLCAAFVPSFASVLPDGSTPAMQTNHSPGHMLMRGGMGGGGMRGGGGGMRGGGMGGGGYRGGGDFGGGSRDLRSSASSNVNFGGGDRNFSGNGNRDINVNNVNVNRNTNINNNGNIHGACYGGCNGWGNHWDHPVAAAAVVGAAVGATAAAIGSVAYSLPPDCGTMPNGYYQCGDTWYQPQYEGTDVQYVVVNPPQ